MGSRARAGRQLPRSFARQLLGCSSSIFSTRLFLLTGSEKPPARRSCWRQLRARREVASGGDRGWISRELSPAARAEVERARRRVAGGDGLMREVSGARDAVVLCAPPLPRSLPILFSLPLSLSPRAWPRRRWARGREGGQEWGCSNLVVWPNRCASYTRSLKFYLFPKSKCTL